MSPDNHTDLQKQTFTGTCSLTPHKFYGRMKPEQNSICNISQFSFGLQYNSFYFTIGKYQFLVWKAIYWHQHKYISVLFDLSIKVTPKFVNHFSLEKQTIKHHMCQNLNLEINVNGKPLKRAWLSVPRMFLIKL